MTRRISALAAVVACASVCCAGVCAGPAGASTAHSSKATQLCGNVSASSVSSIIGYKVPAGVGTTVSHKATKQNDDVAFSVLNCTFGSDTSIASIKKSVSVSIETLSRSLSSTELEQLVKKEQDIPGLHFKIVRYPSLGSEAYLTTFSEQGLNVESIAMESGTKVFGGTVDTSTPISKVVSLVKLAQKL